MKLLKKMKKMKKKMPSPKTACNMARENDIHGVSRDSDMKFADYNRIVGNSA